MFADFAACHIDSSLTDILRDPESADFLKKLVGSAELELPDTAAMAAAGGGSAQPQPLQETSARHNHSNKIVSPSRGRVRPGSRTEVSPGSKRREGSSNTAAAPAAEGGVGDNRRIGIVNASMPDEIAEYLTKPDEFEDLLDECCG